MHNYVNGTISVNGVPFVFQDGVGYTEGDRGHSFPKRYAWTQSSFPGGALMLSVADIPLAGFHFTGVIGVILWHGKEYRLATYLGAKAIKIQEDEITVRQGRLCMTIMRQAQSGHPLCAPSLGAMVRTIHEHPSCKVYDRFVDGEKTLLEEVVPNAAVEYEY